MNALYKKELNASYLILEKTEEISSFSINMLQENKIPGLLPFEKRSFNGDESFYYDISGKYSLETLAKMQSLKEKDIRELFESLLFTIQTGSSYFLSPSGLLLDFSYIFKSEDTYFFCYYPTSREETEEKWKVFAENLISSVNHDDEEAVAIVYGFYTQIKESTLTVTQILQQLLIKEDEGEPPKEKEVEKADEIGVWRNPEEIDKENPLFQEDKIQKENPDRLTAAIFLILAVGSVFYLIYRYGGMEVFSLAQILSQREGILAAVFLLLSIPGFVITVFWGRLLQCFSKGSEH